MEIIVKKLILPAWLDPDPVTVHQVDQHGDEYIILYSDSGTPLDNKIMVVHAVLFHDGKKITVDECNKILSSNQRSVRILRHRTFY